MEFYHFTKHWHWLGLPSYQPSDYVWKLPRSELIRKRNECHIWKFKYQSIKISSTHHKFRKVTSPPLLLLFYDQTVRRRHRLFSFYLIWLKCIIFQSLWKWNIFIHSKYFQAGDSGSHLASLAATLSEDFKTNFQDVLGQLEDLRLAEWSDQAPPPPSLPPLPPSSFESLFPCDELTLIKIRS